MKLGLLAGAGLAMSRMLPPEKDVPDPQPSAVSADRRHAARGIPSATWSRALGEPLATPGRPARGQEHQIDDGYWQGLPLGGLGSGSIGRTYRGEFARWHLRAGGHVYRPIAGNQLSLFVDDGHHQQAWVLTPWRPGDGRLAAWRWGLPADAGRYHALFPRAWYEYDPRVIGVELTVRQFSPVLPHNYRESSLPVGVFVCDVRNPLDHPVRVGIMLTWENSVPWSPEETLHLAGRNEARHEEDGGTTLAGVVLGARPEAAMSGHDGQFAIAALAESGAQVSLRRRFSTEGDGADLWHDFASDGRLEDTSPPDAPTPGQTGAREKGERTGAAVALTVDLQPGESRTLPFALAWDFPIAQFGPDGQGTGWYRRYTRFYGRDGHHAWDLSRDALSHYSQWEQAIIAWQEPILADTSRPEWYKTALFNELYYLVDGGTVWEDGRVGSQEEPQGRFAYLECFDYPFYSTLDVRFYSSWALLQLWPELAKQEIRQFADTVDQEDLTPVVIESTGSRGVRKRRGALPHDLGSPGDGPWLRPNSYRWQDINVWKDLNSKFVLQVYRDYLHTGDRSLLEYCWPASVSALEYLARFDRDGDGLPENDGLPDQTYDTWPMQGPSAYCGGLWIAALEAARAMAREMGDSAALERYTAWVQQARASFEARLWNGQYYQYDTGSRYHDSIMADQLCGQWYAGALRLPEVAARDRMLSALRTIFQNNVMGFQNGQMGAVNGMRPDGQVDRTSDQSQEVWSGVTYALAALLAQEGLMEEAWKTAWGAYNVTYSLRGLWFRTPEAWDADGNYRASMYMRPQAIWAMEHALQLRQSGARDQPLAADS